MNRFVRAALLSIALSVAGVVHAQTVDDLFIANLGGGEVLRVAAGSVAPANPTPYASGFDSPEDIAFDASGNLYVSNIFGNTVDKVTPGGVSPRLSAE